MPLFPRGPRAPKNRIRKKDCPGGQWPDTFPWVRCSEPGCLAGSAAQDHHDLPRHYRLCHPGIVYDYGKLLQYTHKEHIDYINEQHPLPGGGRRLQVKPLPDRKDIPRQTQPLRPYKKSNSTRLNETSGIPPSTSASLAGPSPSAQVNPHHFPLSSNLEFKPPPFTDIKQDFESVLPATSLTDNKRTFTSAFPSSELIMASEQSVRKRRSKAIRSDPGFQGYGCYIPNCDFVSTGKNTLSGHLGSTHGLSQDEKELGKIELINNSEDSDLSNTIVKSTLRNPNKGPGLSGLSRTATKAQTRTTSTPSYTQRRPDRLITFSDPLPPWRAPESSTKSPRVKFDHTRLPIFYKCYADECKLLGRTPSSILKHWQADFETVSKMEGDNPTHCGHLWDIDLVYKFTRDKNGDIKVATHGQSPELPRAGMLDPKNVKQYFPPLSHTHIARIKIRSTETSSTASSPILDGEIWSCILCDVSIGSLAVTKEHIAECHGFMSMDHNAGTKKMHFLAAHADANGETECHVPEGGEECGYVGNGDILHHLVEAHDLLEDDLLDNESTGRIFLTIAEVK